MVRLFLVQNIRYEADGIMKATTGVTRLPITDHTSDTPGIRSAGKILIRKIVIVIAILIMYSELDDNICDCGGEVSCEWSLSLDLIDIWEQGLADNARVSALSTLGSSRSSEI